MITGIIVATLYVLLLTGLSRLSGVKYNQIAASSDNLQKGILAPVGLSTVALLVYSIYAGWVPDAFHAGFTLDSKWLWIIPAVIIAGILYRLTHVRWSAFSTRRYVYMVLGSLVVGFSEELLVRGVLVHSLQQAGYTVLIVGIISSVIFGVLHGINFFLGQDKQTTISQMVITTLMGLNFFIVLGLTGTLWVPILLHAAFDLSLFLQGGELNRKSSKTDHVDIALILASNVLPLVALLFLPR